MKENIKNALKALGYQHGTVKVTRADFGRVIVKVNGLYIGVYDESKRNFVD